MTIMDNNSTMPGNIGSRSNGPSGRQKRSVHGELDVELHVIGQPRCRNDNSSCYNATMQVEQLKVSLLHP